MKGMVQETLKEAGNLWKQFLQFIKENPFVIWIVTVSVLLSYSGCLSAGRIGIDSEVHLNHSKEFLDSWYSIGRFSLVFLKNIFGMRELDPAAANLLMIMAMIMYGVFADFLFFVLSGNHPCMKVFYIIFPALFLTHPCYTQQYLFTVQSFEVAFLMLFCLLAVLFISKWAVKEGTGYLIAGIFCMVWSFGGYQAFVPFYMSAALAGYLIYFYFHREKERHFYFWVAVHHIAAFFLGYVMYLLTVKAVVFWKEGLGFQEDYLEGQLFWSENTISNCIGYIKHYIRTVVFGESVFYPKTFLLFSILFTVHVLYLWKKEKRKEYILYAAAALALVLSPFYLAFYQGGGILQRSQFSLPFVAAFFGSASAAFLFHKRKVVSIFAVLFVFLCSVNQGTTASRAIFSANMTYEHDKMLVQQLVVQMQELNASEPGQKIAMIGKYHPFILNGTAIREETVGYSFFEWDFKGPLGVTKRGTDFMNTLGYPFQAVNEAEYALAETYSIQMPAWPDKGSVTKVGDLVIIKFS